MGRSTYSTHQVMLLDTCVALLERHLQPLRFLEAISATFMECVGHPLASSFQILSQRVSWMTSSRRRVLVLPLRTFIL